MKRLASEGFCVTITTPIACNQIAKSFNEQLGCCGVGESAAESPVAREVPQGAEGEVMRVLLATDHYEVLQVPSDAEPEALRKAKRVKSLATHPDKQGRAAGANEAFARVTEVSPLTGPSAGQFCSCQNEAYCGAALKKLASFRFLEHAGIATGQSKLANDSVDQYA